MGSRVNGTSLGHKITTSVSNLNIDIGDGLFLRVRNLMRNHLIICAIHSALGLFGQVDNVITLILSFRELLNEKMRQLK